MKKYILVLSSLAVFACGGNHEASNAEGATTDTTAQEIVTGSFGEAITADGAISPTELLAQLDGRDSIPAKMKATINECCKKKGCWMTLNMGEGNDAMRVTFKDYGFFVPKNADGKSAIVEGIVFKDSVSVDVLKHYAEDAGKSAEEIAKITEPEVSYSFEAVGVIIE